MDNNIEVESQPKTVVEDTFQISNFNLLYLKESLSGCVNTGLSAEAFLGFIELSLLIDELIVKRINSLKILMNSYGIKETTPVSNGNGQVTSTWVYKDHEKANEIQEKLNAINNLTVVLKPVNFIPKEEFFVFTSGRAPGARKLLMDEVVTLSKVLMQK